jgi:hypothetical protein
LLFLPFSETPMERSAPIGRCPERFRFQFVEPFLVMRRKIDLWNLAGGGLSGKGKKSGSERQRFMVILEGSEITTISLPGETSRKYGCPGATGKGEKSKAFEPMPDASLRIRLQHVG